MSPKSYILANTNWLSLPDFYIISQIRFAIIVLQFYFIHKYNSKFSFRYFPPITISSFSIEINIFSHIEYIVYHDCYQYIYILFSCHSLQHGVKMIKFDSILFYFVIPNFTLACYVSKQFLHRLFNNIPFLTCYL